MLFSILFAVVHADEFGQPMEMNFDGKVRDVAELRGLDATGYFRVQEIDGRFWFVTPEGHRFFLTGCDGCDYHEGGYSTPLTDDGKPRAEFEHLTLPSFDTLPQIYNGRNRLNFLAWNLYRKYGTNAAARQDAVVRARLADWGFNATGKWGWGWKLDGVPYIEDGHLDEAAVMFGGWPYGLKIWRGRYVDMFHPKFAATLEATVRRMTARRRDDRDLIAYALENENGWNHNVINDILTAEEGKAGSFARAAFARFLAERGKMPKRPLRGMKAADFARADVDAFIRFVSQRYHDAVVDAFKRHDPHHLVCGESNSCSSSRAWIEGQALSKLDFISMHEYNIEPLSWYRASLPFLAEHKKPFAILEYSFTGVTRGMAAYNPGTDCTSERARGLAYRHYTEKAAQHPLCLGLSYFILYDQPFTKRQLPGEGHHFGLISQQDRPYDAMIAEVRKSNARLFDIHAGTIKDVFRIADLSTVLTVDGKAAYDCLAFFTPSSVPENVTVERDRAERANALFNGNRSRLKIDSDIALRKGVNAFGTIDLAQHPAKTLAFTFFCRKHGDAAEWPVFETAAGRLHAARTKMWSGDHFDAYEYRVNVPAACRAITVGIDVRDPARSWSCLLARIVRNPATPKSAAAEVKTKVPDDAYGIVFDALPSDVTPMHEILVRRIEQDGDQWITRLRPEHFQGPFHRDGTRAVFMPFSDAHYKGWGNGKREHTTISRIEFGFADAAAQERARRFRFARRTPSASTPSRCCALPRDVPNARVAVLDLGEGEGRHALQLLGRAGLAARGVSAADIADEKTFSRANTDLLIVPTSPAFPYAAKENFRRFLKQGGALFTFGGYAFDRTTAGVHWPISTEMNVEAAVPDQLNTHYGKAGDTMRVHAEAIGLFDPTFAVTNAAFCRTAHDQFLVPADVPFALPDTTNGFLAAEMHAIVGAGNPVVGKTAARRISVLDAFDRFGRRRGSVLSLAVNYRGPYAGSVWAFTAHPTLFKQPDAAADPLFVTLVKRLLQGDFLTTFAPHYDAYDAGEKAVLHVGRHGTTGTIATHADGNAVDAQGFVVGGGKTLLPLTCELRRDGRVIDRLASALVVRDKTIAAPTFSQNGNYLEINGRRAFFGGVNTTGRLYASDRENPLRWQEEFEQMADYGLRLYRIIHLSAFMREGTTDDACNPAHLVNRPETTARRTDALVTLANVAGVVPFIAFHDWMPVDCGAENLRYQHDWNRWWTARYRHTGAAILWDIQNEPQVPSPYTFERKGWRDLAARDGDRKRAAVYAHWMTENAAGAHAGDPSALVTVGNDQDLCAAEKQLTTEGLALMNLHSYRCPESFRGAFKLTDRRFEGKGMSVGEFGSYAAHDGRAYRGDTLATEKALEHYLKICGYTFGLGGSFAAAWAWKDFPEAVFPWGLFHADLTPKPLAGAYRNLLLALGAMDVADRPTAVYLVLPDGFRLGGKTRTIHDGLHRAADALIALGVPFSVINEEGLARLPSAATTLVWPMAVASKDTSFAQMVACVRRGARLLVTGDFRWSYDRQPDRLTRVAELGLPAETMPPVDPFAQDARGARHSADGKVCWLPAAPELKEDATTRTAYAAFFASVARDVACARRTDFPDTWTWMSLPLRNDGVVLTGVNAYCADGGALYLEARDAKGALMALLCAGTHEGFTAEGGVCAFVPEDSKPLATTTALRVLPLGATGVVLPPKAHPTMVRTGEFRKGKWVTYEEKPLPAGTPRKIVFSDDTRFDIRIVL